MSFDEEAVIQEVEYRDVDPRDYLDFSDALGAVYGQYDEQLMYYPVGEPTIMSQMQDVLEQLRILGFLMVVIFAVLLWVLFHPQ